MQWVLPTSNISDNSKKDKYFNELEYEAVDLNRVNA